MAIRSKPNTKEYDENYDRIFGKKKERDSSCQCGHEIFEHKIDRGIIFECLRLGCECKDFRSKEE